MNLEYRWENLRTGEASHGYTSLGVCLSEAITASRRRGCATDAVVVQFFPVTFPEHRPFNTKGRPVLICRLQNGEEVN